MVNKSIENARLGKGYSVEEAAGLLKISPETVLKLESGETIPDGEMLMTLCDIYSVSPERLCGGEDKDMDAGDEITPDYEGMHPWELWSKTLMTEYRQCYDEGKDVECLEPLFSAISGLPATQEKEDLCDVLYRMISHLPIRKGYRYAEPDSLEAIRALRKPFEVGANVRNIADSMLGGWYGRLCGCLLGKPIEGVRSKDLETVCSRIGNWPLSRYIDKEDISDDMINELGLYIFRNCYPSTLGYMPADDDTNYMLTALRLLERYGRDFTSEQVAQTWLEVQPKDGYCTAERVAYLNFSHRIEPPKSAVYKNAYREWIGAQIRADVFGYINPCDPEAAAKMAWNDARISHVKNGIYGEMWVAAMLAAAYGTDDLMGIIRAGLAQVPATSRLYEAVEKICAGYEAGRSEADTFRDIASRWNEDDPYDWCHTIANAEIVAACLLYGGRDYGRSVCLAVSQGFDTDCNGATVGSVLGVVIGYEKLPREWTDRIRDRLGSTLIGPKEVSVTEMANECMRYLPSK